MTAPTSTPPRISTIRRLRTVQPVRFYCWPAIALLLAVLVPPAIAAAAWLALVVELFAVGVVAAAVEAARASTMAPVDIVRAAINAERV